MPLPRRHGLRVALLTAMAVGSSACSSPADAPTPSAPPASSPSHDRAGEGAGEGEGPTRNEVDTPEVLRFSAPRLDGGTVRGEDYSGSDVAFWFWAPW